MAKIIKKRWYEKVTERLRSYDYEGSPGHGFCFPCDETGHVDTTQLQPEGRASLAMCEDGVTEGGVKIIDKGIITQSWTVTHPAQLRCDCGVILKLWSFTNTCEDCGADYNHVGQRLAPREQWGEETGETAADIINTH